MKRGNPTKSRYGNGARILAIILSFMMISSMIVLFIMALRMD